MSASLDEKLEQFFGLGAVVAGGSDGGALRLLQQKISMRWIQPADLDTSAPLLLVKSNTRSDFNVVFEELCKTVKIN